MKITGLDGKQYFWSLGKYVGKEHINCSAGHERTREFLHETYPALQVLEEVHLPQINMFLDFYLPAIKMAVEFQGIQHLKDTRHFFPTKMDFLKAQTRDSHKAEFCRINGIKLIYFYEGEDESEWTAKVKL